MLNISILLYSEPIIFNSSIDNQWTRPALASCRILKCIGGSLCLVFTLGVVLNSYVLYILLNKKHLQSPINTFMIALCSADLIHALFGVPLSLTSNLACRWLYGKYLCYYEGFIAYFAGMIGLYLLTALSLNRYWMIVTPARTKYVTFQTAYISIFLSVVGGFFWAIVPMLGWSDYTLEGVLTSCSVRWQDRTLNVISYNISMFIFAYIIPLVIMIYCNTKIYLKVRCVSKQSLTWKKDISGYQTRKKRELEKRLAKTIFIIIVSFTVAWTPYAIVAFISSFFSPNLISPLGGTIPAIFAKSSISINPLVLLLTNSQIHSTVLQPKKKILRTSDATSTKDENNPLQSFELK